MGGDALRDVNADGGEFALGLLLFLTTDHWALITRLTAAEGPDAGAARDALGQHAEVGAGADEGFFHHADEVDRAQESVARAALAGPFAAQVEDGIADELAGTVIGDVAAAVDLVELDAARG